MDLKVFIAMCEMNALGMQSSILHLTILVFVVVVASNNCY